MEPMKRLAGLLLGLLLVATPASAAMIGVTIEATALFPDLAAPTVTGGPVDAVVGPGIEFSNGQFGDFFGPSFDFDDSTITITTAPVSHSGASFNGYRFFDVLGFLPNISALSIITDTSGFFSADPSRLSFDADNIFINFQDLGFSGDEVVVLGVQTQDAGAPIPEPATVTLLGTGLVLAGARRWRKNRK
jgi:hypothetical protein